MQPETILATRRIYDGRVVSLRVDDVRTPGGLETRREIVEHHGAVALIPIDDAGRVLLVRQYRHAAGRVMIEVPAGTLEPGEDPAACAARELLEETGCTAARFDRIGGIHVSPGFCTEYIHLFRATGLVRGEARPEADEDIEIEAVPWDEAVRRVRDGEIQDAKTVAALLLADSLHKNA